MMTRPSTAVPSAPSALSMYANGNVRLRDDRIAHCALLFVLFGVLVVLSAGVASFLAHGQARDKIFSFN